MAAPATTDHQLPPPLVHAWRHPLRWTRNKAELLGAAVVLAHIGMLIVVSVYYLAFESTGGARSWWHHAVGDPNLRHSVRDVAEGVLGGFLAQAVVWNHFTRSHRKAGRRLRRVAQRFRVPVPVAALAATLLLGAVGFLAAYYGLHAVHARASHAAPHGSVLDRTSTIWRSDWDKKVVGYAASLLARRPLFVVYDSIQLWFAERRVTAGKNLRWYHPPTFRARCHFLTAPENPVRTHIRVLDALAVPVLAAGLGLAGYGWYILTYRA